VVAAYGAGVTLLLTRTAPWHLLLPLPFVAAALPWLPRLTGTLLLGALSATTFVSLSGLLALAAAWDPGVAAVFHPNQCWLSGVMLRALTTDAGITIGGLVNLAAMLGLVMVRARPFAGEPPRPEALWPSG
jgi:hypothetical protein